MIRLFAILAICILSGGCAVGVQHSYSAADTKFDITADSKVAVAVHDRRPYVVSGDKAGNFVGLQRAGFGNPYDVTTESSKTLATDFAAAIVAALEAGGTAVQNVSVLPEESDAAAEKKLLATKTERRVLVTIRDWKTDTYVNTKLIFDVVLRVFDSTGKERAKTGVRGEDNLGGSNFNPPAHARKAVPPAFREKLKTLFNNPKIVAALK